MHKSVVVILAALCLASCGVAAPQISEFYDKGIPAAPASPGIPARPAISSTAVLEFEVEKKIFCELRDAVKAARDFPFGSGATPNAIKLKKNLFLPSDWVVEQSLSLQVDESTALNPGAVLTTPLPNGLSGYGGAAPPSAFAQSFGLGLGATVSSTATRVDKFDPFYTVDYLSKPFSNQSVCKPANDPILKASGAYNISSPFVFDSDSDLGIKDWLIGSLYVSRTMQSIGSISQVQGSPAGFRPDVISIEIKFIIVTNGNINPTWKLVRVSANTGTTPLLGVGRTRTHDLIITIGPPKSDISQVHLASQIGSAVASANRASLIAPSQ